MHACASRPPSYQAHPCAGLPSDTNEFLLGREAANGCAQLLLLLSYINNKYTASSLYHWHPHTASACSHTQRAHATTQRAHAHTTSACNHTASACTHNERMQPHSERMQPHTTSACNHTQRARSVCVLRPMLRIILLVYNQVLTCPALIDHLWVLARVAGTRVFYAPRATVSLHSHNSIHTRCTSRRFSLFSIFSSSFSLLIPSSL
jgi:hypothetical protein